MDIARINLSHESLELALERYHRIRQGRGGPPAPARDPRRPARPEGAGGPHARGRRDPRRGPDLLAGARPRREHRRRRRGRLRRAAQRRPRGRPADLRRRRRAGPVAGSPGRPRRGPGHPRRAPHRPAGDPHPLGAAAPHHPDPRGPPAARRVHRGGRRHGGPVVRALRPRRPPDRRGAEPAGPAGGRQGRDPGRGREPRRHHRGVGRGHGRPRRPRLGVPDRRAAAPAEGDHPPLHRPRPSRDHRHPDARVDDPRRRARRAPRPPTWPTRCSTAPRW